MRDKKLDLDVATGFYLNVFNGKYDYIRGSTKDVFLIFNEPAGEPTSEELTILGDLLQKVMEENPSVEPECLRTLLIKAINETNLECIGYGYQIIVNRFFQEK